MTIRNMSMLFRVEEWNWNLTLPIQMYRHGILFAHMLF